MMNPKIKNCYNHLRWSICNLSLDGLVRGRMLLTDNTEEIDEKLQIQSCIENDYRDSALWQWREIHYARHEDNVENTLKFEF